MTEANLTSARVREFLDYDEATGLFFWKSRAGRHGVIPAGTVAGSVNKKGYRVIRIDGKNRMAHRLAWLVFYGCWPAAQLDHRDGCKSHNAIANLREANQSQNSQNQRRAHKNSASQLLGVYKKGAAFQARITINHKTYNLGYYDTAELAKAAYAQAKQAMHPFGEMSSTSPAAALARRTFSNRGARSTSGVSGVSWDRAANKWRVVVYENGKQKNLGRFSCLQEACEKRAQHPANDGLAHN